MNLGTGHHMRTEKLLCSSFRASKSNCTRCGDLCPVDAIHIADNGPEIDERCIDCGVCFSACPNGAFQITGRDDDAIIGEIKKKLPEKESSAFSISCERGDSSSDIILPCLGRLTERLLLELIHLSAPPVEIVQPDCSQCPSVKASANLDTVLGRVDYLLEMTGVEKHKLRKKNIPLGPPMEVPEKPLSRRFFLGAIGAKAIEAAVKAIPDVGYHGSGKEIAFRDALLSRPENLKRSSLLSCLKRFAAVNSVVAPSKDFLCAEVSINHRCTGCAVCATLCTEGAIIKQETKEHFALSFRAGLCTNCRVCLHNCAAGAVRIKKDVRLDLLLDESDIRLFKAAKNNCHMCGQRFIGTGTEICPLCTDRTKKQNVLVRTLTAVGG
jgi:Fe-S-cluster-containing hydrogenase component 2